MLGIKYWKGQQSDNSIIDMQFSFDTTSNLLFYFLFEKSGYDGNARQYINFAYNERNYKLGVSSGLVTYDTTYWIGIN